MGAVPGEDPWQSEVRVPILRACRMGTKVEGSKTNYLFQHFAHFRKFVSVLKKFTVFGTWGRTESYVTLIMAGLMTMKGTS